MLNPENCWRWGENHPQKWETIFQQGGLEFDEDSSPSLAGPFLEKYAYYSLSVVKPDYILDDTIDALRLRWRLGRCKSEEHLQKVLTALSKQKLREWQEHQEHFQVDVPTHERPYRFFIAGNDDSTWTKYYKTHLEMMEEFYLFEANQPLNLFELKKLGFVFTN